MVPKTANSWRWLFATMPRFALLQTLLVALVCASRGAAFAAALSCSQQLWVPWCPACRRSEAASPLPSPTLQAPSCRLGTAATAAPETTAHAPPPSRQAGWRLRKPHRSACTRQRQAVGMGSAHVVPGIAAWAGSPKSRARLPALQTYIFHPCSSSSSHTMTPLSSSLTAPSATYATAARTPTDAPSGPPCSPRQGAGGA